MSKEVTISQAEYEALRRVYKAARHFVGLSAGVVSRDPEFFQELAKRQEARAKLEEAVEDVK